MISIAIVGPESTGKTELAKGLSNYYNVDWVPEFARAYLTEKDGKYDFSDLLKIAKGQVTAQDKALRARADLAIFDTDLLVIKVWSQVKYNKVDPFILAQLMLQKPDLYLLTNFDIPYEDDPLRESRGQRKELFEIYERELKAMKAHYIVVQGDRQTRLRRAVSEINNLI